MSDSDVEVISNPSRPRAIFDDSQDDELIQIEIATSSPPARRRTPAVFVDDDDDDDDDSEDDDQEETEEEEESLFVSQESSPASESDLGEAGSSLPGVDAIPLERSMMERRGRLFTQRQSAAVVRLQQPAGDYIDLTQEPDSPDYSRLAMPPMDPPRNDRPRNTGFLDQSSNRGEQRGQNARAASRNPRRQAGLVRTPSLARSDASINGGRGRAGGGGNIPLIDLTGDGPEPIAPPQPPAAAEGNAAANNPWNWFQRPPRPAARGDRGDPHLPLSRTLNHLSQLTSQLTAAMRGEVNGAPAAAAAADQSNLPEVIRIIHLDLDYNGGIPPDFWDPHVRPDAEKPKYNAPKEAMEGCTRSTGEDVVAICPSCEEELVYDPDEKPTTPPPAKRQRTKKDRAEHHFMAVKACGHVFCHQCYETRKEKAKTNKLSDHGCGFRPGPNRMSVMCAVEGCDSEVGSKTAWLGIFV
ncbi:hypothetical protein MAPG_09805 [Magnaporthiopsis poae ATCC 64411]|uniref:RING-type domain-containing protein n=1 Tax=Magnaporthiopsis poae (strain ATCC 64411 / 73-15) TaxID=644358 RepID=A0A0C4EAW9_MAGP6|nr:hypothetical protein MAPG_09805 [Magnaporthiopsis poae ATCC 64411]